MKCLNKSINQYIAHNGFINIDIIFNDEFNFQDSYEFPFTNKCANNPKLKNCKEKITECFFRTFSKFLDGFNYFFKINEGFYHKHFTVMNYSYNFNEKNVIFTFNSKYDTSKKNKIRIFDVFFNEYWTTYVSHLILFLYKKCFDFNSDNTSNFKNIIYAKNKDKDPNILSPNKKKDNPRDIFQKNYNIFIKEIFFKKYSKVINIISRELITTYSNNFPDFKSLCRKISKFPIKRYNTIDNLCQHFSNYSLEVLLSKIITNDDHLNRIIEKKNKERFNFETSNDHDKNNNFVTDFSNLNVNLDKTYEPFLNHVDEKMIEIIKHKKNIDSYLNINNINKEFYFKELKRILNSYENFNFNLILVEKKLNPIKDLCDVTFNANNNNNLINEANKTHSNREEEEPFSKENNFSVNIIFSKGADFFHENLSQNFTLKKLDEINYNTNLNINSIKDDYRNILETKKFETIKNSEIIDKIKEFKLRKIDFYYYDNLSNIFIYKEIQLLFELSKDYFFIKKYDISMKHNLNISFDRRDRSIFSEIPENIKPRKMFIKNKKNEILKSLEEIKKINKNNKRLNHLFYEFSKEKYYEIESFIKNNTNFFKTINNVFRERENFKNNITIETRANNTTNSDLKNLTFDKCKLGNDNYFNFRIGHFYFIYRNLFIEKHENLDSLIDYLSTDYY